MSLPMSFIPIIDVDVVMAMDEVGDMGMLVEVDMAIMLLVIDISIVLLMRFYLNRCR